MNRHDMNQKERMLKALPYIADMDGLDSERLECKKKLYEFNNLHPDDLGRMNELFPIFWERAEIPRILKLHSVAITGQISVWVRTSSPITI